MADKGNDKVDKRRSSKHSQADKTSKRTSCQTTLTDMFKGQAPTLKGQFKRPAAAAIAGTSKQRSDSKQGEQAGQSERVLERAHQAFEQAAQQAQLNAGRSGSAVTPSAMPKAKNKARAKAVRSGGRRTVSVSRPQKLHAALGVFLNLYDTDIGEERPTHLDLWPHRFRICMEAHWEDRVDQLLRSSSCISSCMGPLGPKQSTDICAVCCRTLCRQCLIPYSEQYRDEVHVLWSLPQCLRCRDHVSVARRAQLTDVFSKVKV